MDDRQCPSCGTGYPATATLCISCSDVPAALKPGLTLTANLKTGTTAVAQVLGNVVYTISRVLGWGAMATAYLVTDSSGNKFVVKEMLPSSNNKIQAKLVEYFKREASLMVEATQSLISPAFPPFPIGNGWFEDRSRLFMSMQFMDGTDWEKLQEAARQHKLPITDVLQMGLEVCIVLRDHLHGHKVQGLLDPIIHRDIKPANIMKLTTGTSCLLDFGIARKANLSSGTQAKGTRAGSPAFMAPEMERGAVGVPTPATDLYSLCASIYCMIAGEDVFPDHRPEQIAGIAKLSDPNLRDILLKGTEREPGDRWQTADELYRELAKVHQSLKPLPTHLPAPTASASSTSSGTTSTTTPPSAPPPPPPSNQAGGHTAARRAAAPAATPVMPPPPAAAPTPNPIRRVAPPAAPAAGATTTAAPQPLSEKGWFRFFTAVVFGLTCVWFLRELLQAVHEKATGPGLLAFLISFWAFRLAYFGGTGMLKFSTIHKCLVWQFSLLILGLWWIFK